jgi:uncharacterized membrane protein YeiB
LSRSAFLFVVGLLYYSIWPADILHFYGVYMLITLLFLKASDRILIALIMTTIFSFPILISSYGYELGWNFDTYEYSGFWTTEGFFRNLFFNGFHPVIPWVAFMLYGVWIGRKQLNNLAFIRTAFWFSLIVFISIQVASSFLDQGSSSEVSVWSTDPMPPLPLYMLNGMSVATFVITSCIWVGIKMPHSFVIQILSKTGQLALTFYVGHVVIGMGIVELFSAKPYGTYSLEFSAVYAAFFSGLCVLFAHLWLKKKQIGPVEWGMRKLTF